MTSTPIRQAGSLNRLFRMAVVAGVENAVKIHIQRGDDINACDGSGLTPLMLAAMRNKPNVCSILLSAGADPSLEDPSGKDAITYARLAGAEAALTAIKAAINLTGSAESQFETLDEKMPVQELQFPAESITRSDINPSRGLEPASLPVIVTLKGFFDHMLVKDGIFSNSSEVAPSLTADSDSEKPVTDFPDWEPEVDLRHSADDPNLIAGASTVQIAISNHTPFDSSADWDDLDIYLPLTSVPLRHAIDVEAKATLRLLLLRAVREGSVPDMLVVDAATNDDRSENKASESLLRMVINDFGAETDERFEYSEGNDHFQVITPPKESLEEEDIISDAMTFIDTHQANRHDPLRLYQREFQRGKLITADDEVSIAKTMERESAKAIDALAMWPQGIAHVITCAGFVKSGIKPIQWISSGARDEAPEETSQLDDTDAIIVRPKIDELEFEPSIDHKENQPDLDSVDFFERITALSKLTMSSSGIEANNHKMRSTLASLSLKCTFLLGMLDISRGDQSAQAKIFASAMDAYKQARDRMATANLKLVASIANKFLYTGMLLEDLIQDGNVGLLKAVEKYNWRKGFRFSTYATWWIRQSMHRSASDLSRTIRLPVHIVEVIQRLLRASTSFERANGRLPSTSEVAQILSLPIDKAAALMRISQDTVPIDDETIDELITPSAIPYYSTLDPFDVVAVTDLCCVIDRALAELDRKQERIIRLRFGLGVSDTFTLDEIAVQYGVTRERIRQIESQGLRILKNPHRVDKLRNILYGNRSLGPTAKEIDMEARECDFNLAIGDSPSPINSSNRSASICFDMLSTEPNQNLSTFYHLMAQALEMGIDVTLDSDPVSGITWLDVKETPDNRHQKLIRKLLANGFKHMPGKGYGYENNNA